jgi:transcriptional regulator with XRE-family HTH domain
MGQRLAEAIRASGKTRAEVAAEALTTVDTISRIARGQHDNPELQLLIRIALAAKTTVGELLGDSFAISAEDEHELLRFRGWIDGKLETIDASQEPNGVIVRMKEPVAVNVRQSRIADRTRAIDSPFAVDVQLVVRAVGHSMIGIGILPDDTLYAIAAGHDPTVSAIGKVIVCRLGDDVFVKRLVSEHRRLFLSSEHPRYRSIAVDPNGAFDILGVIIGRVGVVA